MQCNTKTAVPCYATGKDCTCHLSPAFDRSSKTVKVALLGLGFYEGVVLLKVYDHAILGGLPLPHASFARIAFKEYLFNINNTTCKT